MEFGQKTYGPTSQSAGLVPGSVPSGGLDMGQDSSKVKMGILGGIVAIFGIGAAVALNGGDEKVAAQQQAKAEREQMMTPTEMAAPAGAPGSEMAIAPGAAPNVEAAGVAGADTAASSVDPNAVAMAPASAIDPAATPADSATVTPSAPEPAAASAPTAQAASAAEPAPKAPQADPATGPEIAMAAPAQAAAAEVPVQKAESEPVTNGEQLASSGAVAQPQAPVVRKPQAVDALDAWWQKNNASTSGFGVQFVGQAADQPSLVIRLSALADPNVAARHIKVKAADGSEVATNWQKGANDYVLVNPNLAPGRYTVSIDPGLTSSTGSTLGMPLSGPIYIQ